MVESRNLVQTVDLVILLDLLLSDTPCTGNEILALLHEVDTEWESLNEPEPAGATISCAFGSRRL